MWIISSAAARRSRSVASGNGCNGTCRSALHGNSLRVPRRLAAKSIVAGQETGARLLRPAQLDSARGRWQLVWMPTFLCNNHVARLKLSRAHGFERTDDEDGN